ncbi:hypothetical protein AB9G26_09720 [Francisella philomiragia]|uniref:hypothetical protein n=1 Tax=Francisella philomiragia TaxID=28110 RepID=UPI00351420A6
MCKLNNKRKNEYFQNTIDNSTIIKKIKKEKAVIKTKVVQIQQIWVGIGNGKGKFINNNSVSNQVLYTTELDTCTAIAIIGKSKNYLVHSDGFNNEGQDGVRLKDALIQASYNIPQNEDVEVYLIGGSNDSRIKKANEVKKIFTKSKVIQNEDHDSIYVTAEGFVTTTGFRLSEFFNAETLKRTHIDKWEDC